MCVGVQDLKSDADPSIEGLGYNTARSPLFDKHLAQSSYFTSLLAF